MANFFTHLTREETWSIAADFNHIVHPTDSPTQSQIEHKDPSFWDRVGGCVFLVLMTPLVVPVILYLYWAGRKVEHIDEENSKKAESRIDEYVQQHPVFLGIGKEQETDVQTKQIPKRIPGKTSNKGLTVQENAPLPQGKNKDAARFHLERTLLAFGPGKNKEAAQKAVQGLEKESLLTPEFRSFLLEEAINHNQVDKVGLLLVKKDADPAEKEDVQFRNEKQGREVDWQLTTSYTKILKPNQEIFNLSKPIPLHRIKNYTMADTLHLLGVNMEDRVDAEGNTAFHLISNLEVLKKFLEVSAPEAINSKNKHGETSAITQLTYLKSLVDQRDKAQTIKEWEVLDDKIKSVKSVLLELLGIKSKAIFFINDKEYQANVFPNNRDGYNAFHLCASIGDFELERRVMNCNSQDTRSLEGGSLFINSVAVIDGTSYTCYDLALQRLHCLKESYAQWVNKENNSEILKKISSELFFVRSFINTLIPAYANPQGDNNYPLHRLVEMGEFNILKKMKLKEETNTSIMLNSQDKNGETPLVLALKKLRNLLQKPPSNEEEKKEWESQVKIQRKFVKFFLKYEHKIWRNSTYTKPLPIMDVNLPDLNKTTALHHCIGIGEPALVKSLVDHRTFDLSSLVSGNGNAPLTVALNNLILSSDAYQMFNNERGVIPAFTTAPTEEEAASEATFKKIELQLQRDEEVIVVLLSKASESANPVVLEALLRKMQSSENSPPLLNFLEKYPSLLQVAFNKLKEIETQIEKIKTSNTEQDEFGEQIWSDYGRGEWIDSLKEKLQRQTEVINILIEYNLTKGKEYYPIFDALERNDPELIKNLVNSENFDINASEKSPYHEALSTLVDLNRRYDYSKKESPRDPFLNGFGLEVRKGITQEEIDEEKRILEEKIRNQKEIVRIVGNKKPKLTDDFLPLCIQLRDPILLEKVLETQGVNVNYLSFYEFNQQKPPLGLVLQGLMKLQNEPSTPEVEEKKEPLLSMMRLLVDHKADQELLELDEKVLLGKIYNKT